MSPRSCHEQDPEQPNDRHPLPSGNLPAKSFIYQEIIGVNLLRQDDGLRFPQIQFEAQTPYLACVSCWSGANEIRQAAMRLQEFGSYSFTGESEILAVKH